MSGASGTRYLKHSTQSRQGTVGQQKTVCSSFSYKACFTENLLPFSFSNTIQNQLCFKNCGYKNISERHMMGLNLELYMTLLIGQLWCLPEISLLCSIISILVTLISSSLKLAAVYTNYAYC